MDEDNPDAAYLLVGAGCELFDAVARQYGLLDEAKAVSVAPDNKAIEAAPENKAILYAPEIKRHDRRFKKAES